MRTITVRLPDDVHQGIKVLAAERKVSISQLYEEISGVMLRDYTAEARFRHRVAQGSRQKGLAILDTLDKYYQERSNVKVEMTANHRLQPTGKGRGETSG